MVMTEGGESIPVETLDPARHLPAGKRQGGDDMSGRISIPEIAARLSIGRLTVYAMLEQGILPGIRLGHRWLVTRHAFEEWERTCGMRLAARASAPGGTGLLRQPGQ